MNQINRVCKIKGHDDYPIFHICTLLECSQPTRWCCSECISLRIHNHNKPNNSHVMKTKELLIKLKSESEKFKEYFNNTKIQELNLIQKMIKECKGLVNTIKDYIKSIEGQIQNIEQQQVKFKSYVNNLVHNNFEQLDDIGINELLNINLQSFDKNQQLLPLDNIKQYVLSIESIIKDQYKLKDNDNKSIDLKDRKYIIQEIDQTNNSYFASSISKNEQYLAYGGGDRLLKIYDIKQKKIIKKIKFDDYIYVCQFTQDSSQLYVGLHGGYAYGYDAQKDFKEIYKQQIHLSLICNIITIQNEYLITCSDDKSIIKTVIKSKQQIFKLTGHTKLIIAIDYNDKDEIIVSGSDDKSIKLWNCRNQSIIIDKEQSHDNSIRQIQLINNNLNILSLDLSGNLHKWKIDLINKDLIKLQQFSDQNKIFNFYQVNQDQNLLLIGNNYAKILTQQGETINTIEHGGQDSTYFDCRQLDNLKYIQIRTYQKIIFATAQDQQLQEPNKNEIQEDFQLLWKQLKWIINIINDEYKDLLLKNEEKALLINFLRQLTQTSDKSFNIDKVSDIEGYQFNVVDKQQLKKQIEQDQLEDVGDFTSPQDLIQQDEINIKMHKKSIILNSIQAYSMTIFQVLDQSLLQPHYNENRFQEFIQFYSNDNFQRELKLIINQDKEEAKIFSQNILIEQIQTQNLKMENDIIFSAAICYDEKYLGFCSYSGQLQIFKIKEQIFYYIKEVKSATVCTFKPNSYQLISGTHDGQIICFDGSDQFNIQYQNKIHNDKINCIKFINESTIITCSNDKDIIITDLENNKLQQKIANAHDNNIMSIDYNYSMKIIASCSLDSSIRIWSLKGDQIDIVNQAHQDFIMQIQFLESKSLLISLCLNGELKLWELSQQKKIEFRSLIRSNDKNFYFQYVQDCSILILACQKYLQIINFESGSIKIIINNMSNYVYGQITQANPKNVLLIKAKGINQIQQDVITIMHKIL